MKISREFAHKRNVQNAKLVIDCTKEKNIDQLMSVQKCAENSVIGPQSAFFRAFIKSLSYLIVIQIQISCKLLYL